MTTSLPTLTEQVPRLWYPVMSAERDVERAVVLRDMTLADFIAILKLLPPAEQAEVAKGCGWDTRAPSAADMVKPEPPTDRDRRIVATSERLRAADAAWRADPMVDQGRTQVVIRELAAATIEWRKAVDLPKSAPAEERGGFAQCLRCGCNLMAEPDDVNPYCEKCIDVVLREAGIPLDSPPPPAKGK